MSMVITVDNTWKDNLKSHGVKNLLLSDTEDRGTSDNHYDLSIMYYLWL